MFRTILRFGCMLSLACLIAMAFASSRVGADSSDIEVLRVDGTIVPVVADYIDRGIGQAESKHATVCIIELNTPGGLLDSTEEIVLPAIPVHKAHLNLSSRTASSAARRPLVRQNLLGSDWMFEA